MARCTTVHNGLPGSEFLAALLAARSVPTRGLRDGLSHGQSRPIRPVLWHEQALAAGLVGYRPVPFAGAWVTARARQVITAAVTVTSRAG